MSIRAGYPASNIFGVHIGNRTNYGRYRKAWYQHTLEFTRSIVATLEPGDLDITRWANEASVWVDGFPNGTQIWDDDVLAQTLATIITTVSVFHTADHDSYTRIPQGMGRVTVVIGLAGISSLL